MSELLRPQDSFPKEHWIEYADALEGEIAQLRAKADDRELEIKTSESGLPWDEILSTPVNSGSESD